MEKFTLALTSRNFTKHKSCISNTKVARKNKHFGDKTVPSIVVKSTSVWCFVI